MSASHLMSCGWFHERHLAPWLPRLCVVALNAAEAEATHGDCLSAGMRRMTRKYGVAAYFDGLRTAEENLCLWYREGDGQDGSCAFEFLLAAYLLSANTDLGHVVCPDRLGYRPTAEGDTARVARYMADALRGAHTTFAHRTCFTALWDADPDGELDARAGAPAASRIKGAAACVLMLLSTHREFFQMRDAELAAAAARLARYKLEAAGADLAGAPPPQRAVSVAAEIATVKRADRMLREVLCGGDDGSPSPYVGHVVRRMSRFAYPGAPRIARPVVIRIADDDDDAMAVAERDEDDADDICDLEVLGTDDDDGSSCDDDGEHVPNDYFPPCGSVDTDEDEAEDADSSIDGDCPLYRALTTSWLE